MAIKKKTGKEGNMLKEVTVTAKRLPKVDSVKSGYGKGQKTFAIKDIKSAVKSGTLKADTTNTRKLANSIGGNSDKADYIAMAIKKDKLKKKK